MRQRPRANSAFPSEAWAERETQGGGNLPAQCPDCGEETDNERIRIFKKRKEKKEKSKVNSGKSTQRRRKKRKERSERREHEKLGWRHSFGCVGEGQERIQPLMKPLWEKFLTKDQQLWTVRVCLW